jgi:hypothetical protein
MNPESEIQQLKKALEQLHDAAFAQVERNGRESLALGAARRAARQLLDNLTKPGDEQHPLCPAGCLASDLVVKLEGDGSLAMFADREEDGTAHKGIYRLFDYSTGTDFPLSPTDLNSISTWWTTHSTDLKTTVSRDLADEIFDATGFNYEIQEVDNDDGTVTCVFDSLADKLKFNLMAATPASEWHALVFDTEKPAPSLPEPKHKKSSLHP